MNKVETCKKTDKEKTLDYLRNQITLMSLAIDKTEEILEQMKKEQREYLHSYELTMKTDEKSMEKLTKKIEENKCQKSH